ncbi:MAG: hypothetical protein OEO20_08790 [Gemmatimonadota bacterium]|nr:hypothetical protein [Gemmatimonadota bacterium]MDH5548933.1 hypothetical protein [Gemmatimonadota bacterium]
MPVKSVCCRSRLRSEAGLSLIEVLIALGILSGVLIALGGLMFQVASNTRLSAAAGYRSAAVTSAEAWAAGLPWDSIDGQSGCVTDTTGLLEYTRCTSVQTPEPSLKQLTVVISPFGQLVVAPETVVVRHTKPKLASPFVT